MALSSTARATYLLVAAFLGGGLVGGATMMVVDQNNHDRRGETAVGDHAVLDGAGINLIRVGERAGSLPQTVASLARIHTNQSQTRLKRFLVLLEPLTILVLSVVLGGIMISVMLAITSLTNVL